MNVFIDLSEFVSNPLRTGIQRVCGELCVHWPQEHPLVPVLVSAGGHLRRLPARSLEVIGRFFRSADPRELQAIRAEVMRLRLRAWRGVPLQPDARVLVPEVFASGARAELYERLLPEHGERLYFLLYDLIPWLRPDLYRADSLLPSYGYPRLLMHARRTAYISAATRAAYCRRLLRRRELRGPVFHLGCDGMGTAEPKAAPEQGAPRFTVVGTLEPRKHHDRILDAFEQVWAQAPEVELHFVGRMGWASPRLEQRVAALAERNPRFAWHGSLSDAETRKLIVASRATLYLSDVEGFGLPPVESLALGVPCIVSDAVPSVEGLGTTGLVRLPEPTAEAVREAVLGFLAPDIVRLKYGEVSTLRLPVWAEMAQAVAAWVTDAATADAGMPAA